MVNALNGNYNIYEHTATGKQVSAEETDASIFSISGCETSPIEGDVSYTEAISDKEYTVDDLKEEYEQIQKEQGIVGKAWNGIKNLLPFLSKAGCQGSKEIEEIIAKAEKGEISVEEAKEALEKYKKNQDSGTEVALNTATAAIATAACVLAGPVGWITLAIGAGVGLVSRVALGAMEAGTNEVENDYGAKEVAEDAGKGAVIGLISGAFKMLGLKGGRGAVINEALEPDAKKLGTAKMIFKGISITEGLKG